MLLVAVNVAANAAEHLHHEFSCTIAIYRHSEHDHLQGWTHCREQVAETARESRDISLWTTPGFPALRPRPLVDLLPVHDGTEPAWSSPPPDHWVTAAAAPGREVNTHQTVASAICTLQQESAQQETVQMQIIQAMTLRSAVDGGLGVCVCNWPPILLCEFNTSAAEMDLGLGTDVITTLLSACVACCNRRNTPRYTASASANSCCCWRSAASSIVTVTCFTSSCRDC